MEMMSQPKKEYVDLLYSCEQNLKCNSPVKPERFIKIMETNLPFLGHITGLGLGDDGLERRSPLVVAMGDSVTAGFIGDLSPDIKNSYPEKFRMKLMEKYEKTIVNVINAGIAGDNMRQMVARTDRDIIRYQPDLVLVNGSINWNAEMGTTAEYKELLRSMIKNIKRNTEADIILLTPNGELRWVEANAAEPTTPERVIVIRELAEEEQVCLADNYAVWEAVREAGVPWKGLLANGINHPCIEGHEVYARVLMKLFE